MTSVSNRILLMQVLFFDNITISKKELITHVPTMLQLEI